jgi:hypothetical protein
MGHRGQEMGPAAAVASAAAGKASGRETNEE